MEGGALIGFAYGEDLSMVILYYSLTDSKAYPRAGVLVFAVEALKDIKYRLGL